MATQLFLLNTVADTHLGTDNTYVETGVNSGWRPKALGTARGSGVTASAAVATVTGPTAGRDIWETGGSQALEWISPPLSADVTISGTITLNIWAEESNMSANVAINAVIEVIRANATTTRNSNTIVQIAQTARTTELAVGARAVNNFTVTPTSTVVNRGDRLRVHLYGDDSAAATMASGFTYDVGFNGSGAAADGDTYVTFTENFSFESAPGVVTGSTGTTPQDFGTPTVQMLAQPFTAAGNLTEVKLWLHYANAPTDDVVIEVQTDSAGSPSGAVVATVATVNNASLTTTTTQYTYGTSVTLTAATTYWLVLRRSGSTDATNRYLARTGSNPGGWTGFKYWNGATWTAATNVFRVDLTFPTTVLYLTDTASDVATASVDKEAWTSRGGGVQNDVVNTVAGWTAPLQLTDTAGGTVVDWFTKQLSAFTLGGMAVANLRVKELNFAINASVRCEIARVNSDGTSPTVWASWCIAPTGIDNGELTDTEAARTCNVSGDDLAFTDGQRIRIRLYAEDISTTAMATSGSVTVYYAGTSGGASGDTYITLPQTMTEFVGGGGAPGPASSRRRRPAHRYLTVR